MRNAGGYAIITDPYSATPVKECDTFTCAHCNGVVHVPAPPAPMPGGYCFRCTKPICEPCTAHDCIPFEKKLEAMERRGQLLKTVTGSRS